MKITTADCKKYLNKRIAKCKDWKRISKKTEHGITTRVFTGTDKDGTFHTSKIRATTEGIKDATHKEQPALKKQIQDGPVWKAILETEKENGLNLGDDFDIFHTVLVELQDGETIEDLKESLNFGDIDETIGQFTSSEHDRSIPPEQIVLSYIKDQQFEVEVPNPFLCVIIPDEQTCEWTLKVYNYKILNYEAGEYSVYEVIQ